MILSLGGGECECLSGVDGCGNLGANTEGWGVVCIKFGESEDSEMY